MVFQYLEEPINTFAYTFKNLSRSNVVNGADIKLSTLTVHSHLDTHFIKQLLEIWTSSCQLLDEVVFVKNAVMKCALLKKLLKMETAFYTSKSHPQYQGVSVNANHHVFLRDTYFLVFRLIKSRWTLNS